MNTHYRYDTNESRSPLADVRDLLERLALVIYKGIKSGAYARAVCTALRVTFEFICSSSFIYTSRIIALAATILGFIGIFSGAEAAPFSLVFGCVFLALITLLKYVTENDTETNDNSEYSFANIK